MDFASLMESQISASSPKDNPTTTSEKKYLKRSELEAQRQANYLKEQEALEKARLDRLEKKRKRDEEEAERNAAREEKRRRLAEESKKRAQEEAEAEDRATRKRLGLPELEKAESGSEGRDFTPLKEGEDDIPEDALLKKLKELGEPRFLFAETHIQRLRRYNKLLATSKALTTAPKLSNTPIPTTIELLPEAEMQLPPTVPTTTEGKIHLYRQIASYFTLLLTEWSTALQNRPQEVKTSFTGKQALQSHYTALSNLTPLFRYLETSTLPPELLAPLHEITSLAQQRRYVDANDAYLRLSIGKAAWPIGVTMVGIHERSAREKLHGGDGARKAHILEDEVTRKLLQGIKRCLSFAQVRWVPSDGGQVMG